MAARHQQLLQVLVHLVMQMAYWLPVLCDLRSGAEVAVGVPGGRGWFGKVGRAGYLSSTFVCGRLNGLELLFFLRDRLNSEVMRSGDHASGLR